jgi:hypothetical protein
MSDLRKAVSGSYTLIACDKITIAIHMKSHRPRPSKRVALFCSRSFILSPTVLTHWLQPVVNLELLERKAAKHRAVNICVTDQKYRLLSYVSLSYLFLTVISFLSYSFLFLPLSLSREERL